MALLPRLFVLACLLGISTQRSTPDDDSYIAAVVEYESASTTSENLANYLKHIQDAALQNSDIIVFPELTLGRRDPVEVPIGGRLTEYPIPALNPELYHNILVTISAAARQHSIYVVINTEEVVDCTNATGEYCPENKTYYFNTNVVFNRNGAIIDRYRKINLFGEASRTPALKPDLGIFETDFGVTFGHFICFDLQFQVPALQVVEKLNITDVIFPTMWFSEMPYLTAVQIQEAYAYSLDINFLASGANNVRVGSAGSGIYSGKAGALVSTMPGVPTTRLLVSRVPKVPGQVNFPVPGPIYDPPIDHSNLTLKTDPSFASHSTRLLQPGSRQFSLIDGDLNCTFRIDMRENNPGSGVQKYKYRAAAFSGIRTYDGVATGGIRACSVVACTGETPDTCGKRFPEYQPNTTAIFDDLNIIASVPAPVVDPAVSARDSVYFPVSLDVSIMPLEPQYYTYHEFYPEDIAVYYMTLHDKDAELYSFGVWGRYFEGDGKEPHPPIPEEDGEPDSANVHVLSSATLILVLGLLLRYF